MTETTTSSPSPAAATIPAQSTAGIDDSAATAVPPLVPSMTPPVTAHRHGQPPRGLMLVPSSPVGQGRFGRMFRELPVYLHAPSTLRLVAQSMVQPVEHDAATGADDKALGVEDDDENPSIPAGYTYLGQFIDHDITFDPVSSLQRQNDPDALRDFRTPRLDLDSLYGRGPDDQPYLYQDDGVSLRTGRPVSDDPHFAGPDLPRRETLDGEPDGAARALLGDPRNEENLIVSQLHGTFIAFHNRVVALLRDEPRMAGRSDADLFKEAQRLVRWHYQWVVVHDFLHRVVGPAVASDVLGEATFTVAGDVDAGDDPDLTGGASAVVVRPRLLFYDGVPRPYMPVEFSVAAYRFGHSMIRPSYSFNDFVTEDLSQQQAGGGTHFRTPIFSADTDPLANLNGFRRLPRQWGFQWKYFFELPHEGTEGLPQPSYKIDTTLVNPLGALPPQVAVNPAALAERNLLRGLSLGLPSGQAVARHMGLPPLTDDQLGLTAAGLQQRLDDHEVTGVGAGAVAAAAADLADNAPLWYYVLAEAEVLGGSRRLGPVGGRIVAEVLVGLLAGDPLSYLNVEPGWTPTLPTAADGSFGMPELIAFATSAPA